MTRIDNLCRPKLELESDALPSRTTKGAANGTWARPTVKHYSGRYATGPNSGDGPSALMPTMQLLQYRRTLHSSLKRAGLLLSEASSGTPRQLHLTIALL
jgi:hypothetical protein